MTCMPSAMLGAREELKRLFRDEELPLWGVCHPSPVARRALDAHQPPPSAGTYGFHGYERLSAELREVVKELICFVGKGVDKIFCSQDTLHNTEFWRNHFHVLWFELTAGLSVCRG